MTPRSTVGIVTCAAFIACAPLAGGQGTVAISSGIGWLARRDIPKATREFRRAAQDPSPALRSAGEQWLGHLAWMVYADAKSASEHLDRALIGANDSSAIFLERARLLAFQRRYAAATRTAMEAMRSGIDGERRGLAARTLIAVAVDGAFAALATKPRAASSVDVFAVSEARDTLRARVKRFPGRTSDARALLDAGILLRDVNAIVTGWTSYYALTVDSTVASIDSARHLFERSTARDTSVAEWRALAIGLAMSRLYESAALLLKEQSQRAGVPLDARATDVVAYGVFARDIRVATDDFYRRALLRLVKEGDLDRLINARTRSLWAALRWPGTGPTPAFFPAAVPGELQRRFGAIVSIDRGAVIPELYFAHAIASFVPGAGASRNRYRRLVLDGLVTKGVDFWLLDGAGGRAGWANRDTVFELRTSFTETPFRAWNALTDPQTVPGELLRIQRDSVADIARARADSVGYLPGVAARIFRAGTSAILDSISRDSMPYAAEEAAFVRALFEDLTATTITTHEARHVADARRTTLVASGVDAEFRAKIDEVSGARRPKLALTAILHPNIGDATPHGQANRRVMFGLVRWIRAHASELVGFQSALPALVQLPLLTDAQLRAAFQSMRTAD